MEKLKLSKDNNINVVITSDRNYIQIIDVAMISILKNIAKDAFVNFYVFSYKFSPKDADIVKNLEAKYNCKIHNVPMENYIARFAKIDTTKFKNQYISIACYFRLLIFDILPDSVENCFYVDSDIIVACDLTKIQLSDGKMFKAVIEPVAMQYRDTILNHCYSIEEFKNFVAKPYQYPYFNAGFFYVNLTMARKLNIYNQITKIIKKYPELPYADQDILNMIFGQKYQDLIEYLPPEYNMFADQNYLKVIYDKLPYPYDILKQACKQPLIYHFGGANKPWLNNKIAYYHKIWWKYAKYSRYYISILFSYYLKRIEIFSIRNSGIRKVITIFGIKFKFKSQKLIKRQQELSFSNKLDLLFEELNVIKNLNTKLLKQQTEYITTQKFSSISSALNATDKTKYKNSFLLFRYNYLNALNEWGVNLGDYVQTIATQHVINSIFGNITFKYWDRDNLSNYSGEDVFTVMQGWFSHSSDYLPNDKILPVFIGTHITTGKREEFIKFVTCNNDYFKNITFGCRDTSTLKFMQNLGLKSYLSRCLTLTLPKREIKETQNKVYIVDIPSDMLKYIPQAIRDNAIYRTQRSIDGNKETSFYINSEQRYMEQTSKLLQEYSDNAKLIITSALHCASPTIAMGIPTILIDFEDKNDRFGSLNNIFKINTKEDLINGKINFHPTSVDIEELKHLMINNVELSIKQAFGENIDNQKLNIIREKIVNYKII